MESSRIAEDEMDDLLSDLEQAAKTSAKQRTGKISGLIDKICSVGYESGLSNTSLSRLIDIVTQPNELDQASTGLLIKNVYPVAKVPDIIVIKIVGCLGHGKSKAKFATQAALLNWLILVYDVLENQSVLSQLYAIVFNLLDTIAIRAPLCHVLSLITRRKHVRPYRIQVLMELTRWSGNEPHLVGLMRVYKDYYPDVIIGDVIAGRASVFTHPNPEWKRRLADIQENHFHQTQDGLPPRQQAFRVLRRVRNTKNKRRSLLIPEVHTFHAFESSITLEEIEDVNEFVQKLEKIEPPNQLVAVIGDPLLQKFLQLRSTHAYFQRVDSWLMSFFEDQLQNPDKSEASIMLMLEAIRGYTRYTKQLPPACLLYLQSMLPEWNGATGRELILELLTYVPIRPFSELYETILSLIEDAILEDVSWESMLSVLVFYEQLLDRWSTYLLSRSKPTNEEIAAISALIDHVNTSSLTMVQTTRTVNACSAILSFYECVASLITNAYLKSSARIIIPPAELVYTLYFSNSLSTASRLCAILAVYKRAFELAMAPKQPYEATQESPTYAKEYVNYFNGFLMDVCNCVWRARALNTVDPNSLGCLLRPQVTGALSKYIANLDPSLTLQSLFGVSTSPVLCLFAITYVRELEDAAEDDIARRHAGPVTQASLKQLESMGGLNLSWQDYKLGVLQYLETKGAPGIGELMYNTMKHLMAARNR